MIKKQKKKKIKCLVYDTKTNKWVEKCIKRENERNKIIWLN